MKLSDYVARFLANRGIRHIFAVSGGASLHIIDSVARTPGVDYICPQHEQAGAMAADGYARIAGIGAAAGTSGPGATNMITGVCCSYYDSIPVMIFTGQVATFRMKGDSGVRQLGFQETDTLEMFRSITKYAVLLKDPKLIRYELEKAYHVATTGRPGPVLIDLPDNIQREDINPDGLEPFVAESVTDSSDGELLNAQVGQVVELLAEAERPVVIVGWGIRLSRAERDAIEFVEKLGFPVVPTWAMLDLLPSDHPLVVGGFGTHGTRYGNFAVQNSDLVLSVGSRLDTHEAGSPHNTFAREARKVVVDVDLAELGKFARLGMPVDVLVGADAGEFLRTMAKRMNTFRTRDISTWKRTIAGWKRKYPACREEFYREEAVNPYAFVAHLSRASREGDIFFLDTGCALAWMMQGFEVKKGQRLFHDFNNTAMGYGLPGAIGASIALNGKAVTCVTGDGSLQMNIQELATVIRHQLPLKIFLLNNHGYSMIQQTQEQWLGSRYTASSVEGGLAFPDFSKVAAAYGYQVVTINRNCEIAERIAEVMEAAGPVFCDVQVPSGHRVVPQVKFGRPIEDSEPLLPRDEFLANMIVKPLEASLRDYRSG